jgi:Ankyrin repeats (3 copies)
MKRLFFLAFFLHLSVLFAASDYEGTATGELRSNENKANLRYSYAVKKTKRLSVILSDRPVPIESLGNYKSLVGLANEGKIHAIEVVIDSNNKASEVFFFDDRIPSELSVKDPGPFTPKKVDEKVVSGKLVMNDPGYSFGYDVTFSAPVFRPEIVPGRAVNSGMTSEEAAKTGLKNAGLSFDEDTFTSKVQSGDAGAVELFLQAGMPPVVHGRSAIWTAVEFQQVEVAKLLIDRGQDVNERGEYGQTLVMLACDHKDVPMLQLLIQSGANVNQANDYKITPLASGAEQGNKEIIEVLLAAGANVNARNTYGGTALQVAVLRGHTDIVKRLIDAGADVARDRAELLEIAHREKHPDIEKLLMQSSRK